MQRLSTLSHFCADGSLLEVIGRSSPLMLRNLTKLPSFNGKTFSSLPRSLQLNFQLRPVRVTTLNDKSDYTVRYDLFERLNTGGVKLHAQEIRNCVLRGELRNILKELSSDANFLKVVRLPENEQQAASLEECVLRFFAFFEKYELFDHGVGEFLTEYMIERTRKAIDPKLVVLFRETMAYIASNAPDGIARGNRSSTPVNLFEGVAVGTALALRNRRPLRSRNLKTIMNSEKLKEFTTGATNSRPMVVGRIEYVRDALLRQS